MRQNTRTHGDVEQERLRGERLAAESERQRELDREQRDPRPHVLPDGGEDEGDEWNPEPASLRDGETTDLSSHAQRNLETINEAEEEGYLSEEKAEEARESIRENDEDDDEEEIRADGGVSVEDMESVEAEEFDLADPIHAIVDPLPRDAGPVDLRGTVVETVEEDSPSLVLDTGTNAYRISVGGSVYRLPTEDDEDAHGKAFEELKGTFSSLFRDSSSPSDSPSSSESSPNPTTCAGCDYEGEDVELVTETEEVEEVVSSRYDHRDPRYDPETRTRVEGYEIPLCPDCRGDEEGEA